MYHPSNSQSYFNIKPNPNNQNISICFLNVSYFAFDLFELIYKKK